MSTLNKGVTMGGPFATKRGGGAGTGVVTGASIPNFFDGKATG